MLVRLAVGVALAAALGGCGGTLEDDYRKGKVPGQTPSSTAAPGPGAALSRGAGLASMARVERTPTDTAGGGSLR